MHTFNSSNSSVLSTNSEVISGQKMLDTLLIPLQDQEFPSQNLVFVDAGIYDIEHLIQGIEDAEIVVLDSNQNGIEQITTTLGYYDELASVHFISHGQPGSIKLGNTYLNSTTLSQYDQLIPEWNRAMSKDGDFLFYACDFAFGDVGVDFINQLRDVTGVDIAASGDITGSEALGGDWILEVNVGEIEAKLAFSSELMTTYESTLALPTALFVVGDTILSASDQSLQNRLEGLGYEVMVQDDNLSQSNDATGHNLVLISESVSSSRVNTKFTDASVPVISAESYLFDDLELTTSEANLNFGKQIGTSFAIVEANSPLVAGLSGTATVYNTPNDLNWGQPNNNALTVATLPNNSDRATIFAYEQGATLINGIAAPSRRVGLFIGSNANQLTSDGWNLFDSAVNWASEETIVNSEIVSLSFSQDQFTVEEDADVAAITIDRVGNISNEVAVTVATTDTGTANAGDDYEITTEVLLFAANETTKTFTVPIVNDTNSEADETIGLSLSNPVDSELGREIAILTILDNDQIDPEPNPTSEGNILFIANSTDLKNSDLTIKNQLESFGYQVSVQDDDLVNLSDVGGQDVIFISESVQSGRINTKLNNATIPIISAEAYLFGDLELTDSITNIHYGVQKDLTAISITNSSNPIADGLTDEVKVYETSSKISWGKPNADAEVVAVLPNNSEQAAIFAYDETDALISGEIAPAKRVGFFMGSNANQLTADGWRLLESTIQWAIGNDSDPNDPGILKLGETEISVNEGAGEVTVEFLRTNGSAGTATLEFSTIELTADADVDYLPKTQTLTFAPGETRKTSTIQILDDNLTESSENFGIGLTSSTGALLGAPRTAVITIVDNDNDTSPPQSGGDVLFVAGSPNLSTSDQVIQNQFELLGYTVTVQDDDLSSDSDAIDKELVFISESVSSSKVTNKFANIAIPVISAEAYVFDDMGLTGAIKNSDYGALTEQTKLIVDSTNSDLTTELSGEITVFDVPSKISWGISNNTALSIATLANTSNQAGIFAYDEGTTLVNGDIAAARRVGFFIGSNAQNVTADGWALFASTVDWVTDTVTPRVSFSQSEFTVNEGNSTAEITVKRSGNTVGEARVNYSTSNGSARSEADYSATSGTLVFNDTETIKTFTVPILEDSLDENPETLNLTLSNPVSIDLGVVNTATLTILDNDEVNGEFVRETVLSGLTLPTSFDWTPNGNKMFIAEKSGLVKVYQDGILLETPFIDLQDRVNSARDRGLLGLAVHPDFPNTPYVYLAYTYDPPEVQGLFGDSGPDGQGNRPSQVIRVTADSSTNFTTALPNSEIIILGKNSTWANTTEGNSTSQLELLPSGITESGENIRDYLTTDSESHSIGALQFGTDGSLFVSNGDGASFNFADPRAVRVQDIDNLSGKILRVDPETGQGLNDNPFFDGDPDSNRSKVYSYGFRNPFRFTINPETNEPFIGDVGWTQWEEINTGKGTNHGWPYFEGGDGNSLRTNEYQDFPEAQTFYQSGVEVESSIFAFDHFGDDRMRAIIMGDFYDGESFPVTYEGALFFSGFERGNVYYLTFNADGDFESVDLFDTEVPGISQITTGLDSHLYYLNLFEGSLGRWRFQQ